jgi:hypothetical protein
MPEGGLGFKLARSQESGISNQIVKADFLIPDP